MFEVNLLCQQFKNNLGHFIHLFPNSQGAMEKRNVSRREQKSDMKTTILRNRHEFQHTTNPTSVTLARIQYDHWVSLPEADSARVFEVTAFGGFNMNMKFSGTLASTVVRMGHLRMFNPIKYGPCVDPYKDYADNESLYLPTIKTTDQKVYRVEINILAIHIDLVKGVHIASLMGMSKHMMFPLQLKIENMSVRSMDISTRKKINIIMSAFTRFGRGQGDWPYHVPDWVKTEVLYKPLKIRTCESCHKKNTVILKCANCCGVYYCGKKCQKDHWKEHKNVCTFTKRKII